jgi:hypothetical protein
LKGLVDVARPLVSHYLRRLLLRQLIKSIASALAEATVVQREHVDSGRRKLCGEAIPDLALPVALMEQEHSWAALASRKICCL